MPREKPKPAPEAVDDDGLPARSSIWSGTISFGLVSIPVMLRPAVREGRLALRMLTEDGTPLARRYYCPADNRDVPSEHIVRGYEIDESKYVVVTDEELESLEPEKSRDIDLRLFVEAAEVDPIYFERSYFLLPDKETNKAYRLLAETMQRTRKTGIATFIMHDREHLVAIIAEGGVLRAEIMRFHDEVRRPEELDLTPGAAPSVRDTSKFEKVIASLGESRLSADELRSGFNQKLQKLVEQKRRQGRDLVEASIPANEQGTRKATDLLAELRRSIAKHRTEPGRGSKSGRRDEDADEHTERRAKAHPRRASGHKRTLSKDGARGRRDRKGRA